jgi:dUTP pyrophosphatase
MISLTFNPLPTLTINDNTFYGINIIEKLYELKDSDEDANKLFQLAALAHQRTQIPRLGFNLESENAVLPTKRITDVGYDITIVSVVEQITPITTLFETNVSLQIPLGYYAELVPRSSLSKSGYMLCNSVGIIDPGYTGTIKVKLVQVDPNLPNLELPVRVAQIILKPYIISESYTTNNKIETTRGQGGFGSTG